MATAADFFVAGGTLRPQTPSYIRRPADQELFEHVLRGEFCYVLTCRQMGKSSLMVQTARQLREQGVTPVLIDLTSIGTVAIEPWYLGLLTRIVSTLRLSIDLGTWWAAHAGLGIPQRFASFLHDVLLTELATPIVIFIDEIDSTLNLPFRDDFFAVIRAVYNARAADPSYERLTFVLLGVAAPTDLIQDRQRTPFNIGRQIVLQEFTQVDARVLETGLEVQHPGQGRTLLERIFYWSNGHPYLTQKLCLAVAGLPPQPLDDGAVDRAVNDTFLGEEGRKDTNLTFVQNRVETCPPTERGQLLRLYGLVYSGKPVRDDDRSPVQNLLELIGLVRVEQGRLQVRNEIYRRVFNQNWIGTNIPVNRQRSMALGAGLIAVVAVLLLWVYAATRQATTVQTTIYTDLFATAKDENTRVQALAGLFNLPTEDSRIEANRLFYSRSAAQQQVMLVNTTAASAPQLVRVIWGLSRSLDTLPNGQDRALLQTMIDALKPINQGKSVTTTVVDSGALQAGLEAWLAGREAADQQQETQAVIGYTTAITLLNDNPVVYYDRATSLVHMGDFAGASRDFQQVVNIAHALAPTPTPVLVSTAQSRRTITTGAPAGGSVTSSQITGEPDIPPLPAGSMSTSPASSASAAPGTDGATTSTFSQRFVTSRQILRTVESTINQYPPLVTFLQQNPQAFQNLVAAVPLPIVPSVSSTATASEIAVKRTATVAVTDVASPAVTAEPTVTIGGVPIVTPVIQTLVPAAGSFVVGNKRSIQMIVLHATAGLGPGILQFLQQGGIVGQSGPRSSVHYYIDKQGTITHLVADANIAFHAGIGSWTVNGQPVCDTSSDTPAPTCNDVSLGVELENLNDGRDPYPTAQYMALVWLVRRLVAQYAIPPELLVRHLDITPASKTDPAGFPWEQFKADVYSTGSIKQ